MMARLQAIGLTVLAVLLVLVGAYGAGSARARRSAELKQSLDEARRRATISEEVRDVALEVDRLPDGSASDQLKRDWLRRNGERDSP